MSSASVGRSDDGVVSVVDGAIPGDGNAGHPDSAVGFDLESAWSFRFVPSETSVISSEDLSGRRRRLEASLGSLPDLAQSCRAYLARGLVSGRASRMMPMSSLRSSRSRTLLVQCSWRPSGTGPTVQ